MDAEAAKLIGAGLAAIGMGIASLGVGNVFASSSVSPVPSFWACSPS